MIKERINVGLSKASAQDKKLEGQKFIWELKVKFVNSDQWAGVAVSFSSTYGSIE